MTKAAESLLEETVAFEASSVLDDDGSANDEQFLAAALARQGMRIIPVAADGNCCFSACARHLEGGPEQHDLRKVAVDFISQHKAFFTQFPEQEALTFEDYLKNMRKDKTWGGIPELSALSGVYQVELRIYHVIQRRMGDTKTRAIRVEDVRWEELLPGQNYPVWRLSYHGRSHYNAVSTNEIAFRSFQEKQQLQHQCHSVPKDRGHRIWECQRLC